MSEKLRIAVISSGLGFKRGGSAVSEASLCKNLLPHCELEVFAREGLIEKDFCESFGFHAHPYKPLDWVKAYFNSKSPIAKKISQVQVVHLNGHWRWENYFISLLCKKNKIPYVVHPRGMFWVGHRKIFLKRIFNSLLGKSIAKHAGKVIALSEFETKQYSSYKINKDKLEVLPNGIQLPKDGEIKAVMVPKSYFLYLGRIESRKNLLFLVEGFKKYVDQGGRSQLLMVGPVEHGYDDQIRKKVLELKLAEKVRLLPPVFEGAKWGYYLKAKAVIYPGVEEAFGRVPFEAVGVGVPALVPRESGSFEYLKPFLASYSYENDNASSLAQSMLSVEENPPILMGEAQEWVQTELNWEKVSNRVLNIYHQILPS